MSQAWPIEWVPNVSEGRRPEVIAELAAAVAGPGVVLLDVHADADHHRSVLTVAGSVEGLRAAALRLATVAVRTIDLNRHRGVHPRIGALDVSPFVPLGTTPMQTCVELAWQVGDDLASQLGLPVYFYGEAALSPARRRLANLRRGGFEALKEKIRSDPSSYPDRGPAICRPAGAAAVGARQPLIAFNVLLQTSDLAVAQAVARQVRASSGGLPGVQALGFALGRGDVVQVSLNVTDLQQTPLWVAFRAVCAAAQDLGVTVGPSELVGLAPADAFLDAAAEALGLPGVSRGQVLDLALFDRS